MAIVADRQGVILSNLLRGALRLGRQEPRRLVARLQKLQPLQLGDGAFVELVGADEIRVKSSYQVVVG
jgi:hypothetical protein